MKQVATMSSSHTGNSDIRFICHAIKKGNGFSALQNFSQNVTSSHCTVTLLVGTDKFQAEGMSPWVN